MKIGFPKINWPKTRLPPVNWFGLVAGVLMLVLPFLGPWWRAAVGTGAADIELSPFDYHMSLLGKPVSSTLMGYFFLAAKITMIIAGIFMILGSAFPKRWWSRRLIRFGVMKPFWSIIILIIPLVLIAFFLNNVLPGILSGMVGAGSGTMQLNVPYIAGTTTSTVQIGSTATVTAPITASITGIFWVAVGVAAFGVAARIYHRRFQTRAQKEDASNSKRA